MWRSSMHKVKPVTNAFNFSAQCLTSQSLPGFFQVRVFGLQGDSVLYHIRRRRPRMGLKRGNIFPSEDVYNLPI